MDKKDLKTILRAQKNEITELAIYRYLKEKETNPENQKILEQIAQDEERHYLFLKNLTKKDVKPNSLKIKFYFLLTKIFGLAFGLKLMEKGERWSQKTYQILEKYDPEFAKIFHEEQKHEKSLLQMIQDTRVEYTGSFVLGLNDALIELTGALAGLTLSLAKTKLIAFVGLITGIAAAFSMSASEYLSTKEEGNRNPYTAALITGIAYFLTVILLILPYLLFSQAILALFVTFMIGTLIILAFNFYVSVVKDVSLKNRFWEMMAISFGIAFFNFFLGFFIKKIFNLEV